MARSSGLRITVQIFKAIDKATRDAERRRKLQEREEAKRQREHKRALKQEAKERSAYEKQKFKKELEIAKKSFEKRCVERQNLRNEFVDLELR